MRTDKTARKKLEEERIILRQRLLDLQFYTRSRFEADVDALLTIARVGIINDVNDHMETLTGCIRDELIGSLFKKCLGDDLSAENSIQLTTSQEKTKTTSHSRDSKGRETPISYSVTTLYKNNRQLQRVLATLQDITERKIAGKQILELALYDSLTGLPNRRFSALMFLDSDNFKACNDLHGHFLGDVLLVGVARRLAACVRQIDVVVRFDGDDFVGVLSEIGANRRKASAQAHSIAEKPRTSSEQPYVLDIQQRVATEKAVKHCCTTSIGVVVFADKPSNQDEVLKWDDSAMYQAKELEGNRIEVCDALTKMLPAPLPTH